MTEKNNKTLEKIIKELDKKPAPKISKEQNASLEKLIKNLDKKK